MNDLCERYGFKILAYGVLVSISLRLHVHIRNLDLDIGLSAVGFSPTGGWGGRSQSCTRAN